MSISAHLAHEGRQPVTLLMEQGAAPAGVALSAMPPGRSGLAGRSYYDGLQVVLLDADWMKAGESLPDRSGRGSFCPGPEERLRKRKIAAK